MASVIRMAAARVSLGRWGRVIQPEGHWGPRNEVGSYILAKYYNGFSQT